ncbi:hypothetical protein ACTI_50490 [Actinoplanes sp. OR16]|uniref:zeta toxin family protein n=1 Tax=Actinoplanes sp. OR16 TaxID=946334 RepID=UPI000F6CFB3B|nr:zeta toxin family protein [Actinoplanes sp. OR16]BBH68364.1 hypothetical protein ACTI_50490 [Actinoplanes sp. OR16]
MISEEEAVRRFHERIVPRFLSHGVPRDQPVLVIVAGQPGAGKTAVEDRVGATLGTGAVTIDADKFRPVHPDFIPLVTRDDRAASQATHGDAVRWVGMATRHCIEQRYDVVLSTTLRTPEAARSVLGEFRDAGYRVEVVAMAVHETASRLSVLSRYQEGRADVGYGRYVPESFQRDAYAGLLSTMEHVEREHLADAVHVFLRDGTQVYGNALGADGRWVSPPGARAAVETGRARPWSPAEIEQFEGRAGELAEQLPPDLRGELRAVTEDARDRLVVRPQPPLAATAFPHPIGSRAGRASPYGPGSPGPGGPGPRPQRGRGR